MADPIQPISDPNRDWKIWNIDEIYTGPTGTGQYVPNVGDLVFSTASGWNKVDEVDRTTYLSVIVPTTIPAQIGVDQTTDRLLGVGPGSISESYRLYIDDTVLPYKIAFDHRLHTYSEKTAYCKVVRGTDVVSGEVISRRYDIDGNVIDDKIMMNLAPSADFSNVSVKVPDEAYSTMNLDDAEVVTAIFYTSDGVIVSTSTLLVKNTKWIRSLNESTKYITSIEMVSSFMSVGDNHLLEIPINMPFTSIPIMGVVNYSDGSSVQLPIDGTKFRVYGLDQFVSSILGQTVDITLMYFLSQDETVYGSVDGSETHLAETYQVTTTNTDGAYSVKLFSYPTYIDAINGYQIRHYLYNLDRDTYYDVTQNVTLAANTPPFDPTLYATIQKLTFSVNLSDVNVLFNDYTHLQTTDVVLYEPGTNGDTRWTVKDTGALEAYGTNLIAVATYLGSNLWDVTFDNGFVSEATWIQGIYEKTNPLFDSNVEAVAPTPTHFRLVVDVYEVELPVSSWNAVVGMSAVIADAKNAYLHFFKRTTEADLYLSTAALSIKTQ